MIGFSGSRQIGENGRAAVLVKRVVRQVIARGHRIAVGCAVGVDQIVLRTILECTREQMAQLEVFAVGGPDGVTGFWKDSAVHEVVRVSRTRGQVHWYAGGRQGSMGRRLMARSAAMVWRVAATAEAEKAALVAFLDSPNSRGTVATMREAARQDLPVIAFPVGFSPEKLPRLGEGGWVQAADSGLWSFGWKWTSE